MAEKQFIGNCKKIGNWATGVGLHKDSCTFNEKGWINIVVVHNSDSPDKKAYAYIDDWKPDSTKKAEKGRTTEATETQAGESLPF